MHPENELLARDEAQRADEPAVAIVAHYPLILPARERVRPRGADLEVPGMRTVACQAAKRHELGRHGGNVGTRSGRDLEHRLEELGLDLSRWRLIADDRVDRVD